MKAYPVNVILKIWKGSVPSINIWLGNAHIFTWIFNSPGNLGISVSYQPSHACGIYYKKAAFDWVNDDDVVSIYSEVWLPR